MKENINKIEMLQRRAARWVCYDYSPYSSVTDILSILGWRSLEFRRYDSLIAMFCHYENTPIQIYRKFQLQIMKIFKYKKTLILFKFLLKT